jgi:hypothetical protein
LETKNNLVLFLDHLLKFRRSGVPIEHVDAEGQIGFFESFLDEPERIVTELVWPYYRQIEIGILFTRDSGARTRRFAKRGDNRWVHASGSILRVLALLAVPAPAGPGHRLQAGFANGLPAFFTDSEFLVLDPGQSSIDGAQKFPVRLLQPDLRCRVSFTGRHIDRVAAKVRSVGIRIEQGFTGGEFLLFRKEKILVAKQVALIHDSPLAQSAANLKLYNL